jgi:hypothetical protein
MTRAADPDARRANMAGTVLMPCAVVMLAIAITKHSRLFAVGAVVAALIAAAAWTVGHSDRHVLPPRDPRGRTEFAPATGT